MQEVRVDRRKRAVRAYWERGRTEGTQCGWMLSCAKV